MISRLCFSVFLSLILVVLSFAQEKINIGILDLQAQGVSQTEAVSLTNRIRSELFRTGHFTIVEREKIDEVLAEQGIQQSGCTSSECIIQLGQILNVQKMIAGSVDKLGRLYTIHLRMIDVQSGEVLIVATADCEGAIEEVAINTTAEAVYEMVTGLGMLIEEPPRIKHVKKSRPTIATKSAIRGIYMPERAMTVKKKSLVLWESISWEAYRETFDWNQEEWVDNENYAERSNFRTVVGYGITSRWDVSFSHNSFNLNGVGFGDSGFNYFIIQTSYQILKWTEEQHGLIIRLGRRFSDKNAPGYISYLYYTSPWIEAIRFNVITGINFLEEDEDVEIGNEFKFISFLDISLWRKLIMSSTFSYFKKQDDQHPWMWLLQDTERERFDLIFEFNYAFTERFIFATGFSLPLAGQGGERGNYKWLFDFWYVF